MSLAVLFASLWTWIGETTVLCCLEQGPYSLPVPRPVVVIFPACTRDKGEEAAGEPERGRGLCQLRPATRLHTYVWELRAARPVVPRRVLHFITDVSIKGTWVRANIRGGKTKEIKCKLTAGANHMEASALIPPEPVGGSGPQESEPKDVGLVFLKPGPSPV